MNLPLLKSGMSKAEVVKLKAILRSQGMWTGSDSPDFGPKLEAAVRYFQTTHLGPNGKYLKGDGEVGEGTWWALLNPSGAAQTSNIIAPSQEKRTPDHIPKFDNRYGRLSAKRQAFLRVLFIEHGQGVKEVPDGSNQGDGVDKYIVGFGPVYWCALFISWAWKAAFNVWPKGTREAGVRNWWRKAVAGGYAHPVGSGYIPVPGDLAMWGYKGGAGHISAVVATNVIGDFNTVGGNEGNRVKLGLRHEDEEPQLLGYVDMFGDGPQSRGLYVGGLLKGGDTAALSQGGTR